MEKRFRLYEAGVETGELIIDPDTHAKIFIKKYGDVMKPYTGERLTFDKMTQLVYDKMTEEWIIGGTYIYNEKG